LVLVEKMGLDVGDQAGMILVGILEGPVTHWAGPHAVGGLFNNNIENQN